MCEYCGCQALQAVADLTAEHDEAVTLIGRARAAVEGGNVPAAARAARALRELLGPHTAVEEQALFPALARDFPDHVSRFVSEHRALETVLDEAAAGTPADAAWPQRLLAALAMLREHILAEQDGAFPAALSALSASDWDAVDAVRARVGSVLPPAPLAP